MSILDLVSLAVVALLLLWGVWALLQKFWPAAAATPAGQVVGGVVQTTQAYAWYGMLESMKLDDQMKADPSALSAIVYLESVALRGVASWRTVTVTGKPVLPTAVSTTTPATAEPAILDAHAAEINWRPGQ